MLFEIFREFWKSLDRIPYYIYTNTSIKGNSTSEIDKEIETSSVQNMVRGVDEPGVH